ncbi:MAG: hypothetical protein RID23_08200 [Roseovarius sp.]
MTRLYVHIGAKKTGTTTIQAALKACRDVLIQEGIYVSTLAGQLEDKAFTEYYRGNETSSGAVSSWYEDAVDFIRNKGGHSAIITAESLSDFLLREIMAFKEDIPDVFDEFCIIYYIRRQDLAAVSHYSTALKGGGISKTLMSEKFGDRSKRGLNYFRVSKDWAKVFGRDAMRVKLYPDHIPEGWDILDDFASVDGLEVLQGRLSADRKNTSLSKNIAAYLRRFNELARKGEVENSHEERSRYVRSISHLADGKRLPKPDHERAVRFYRGFAGNNKRLRQEFFQEKDRLFSRDFSMYPEVSEDLDDFVDEEVLRESMKPFLKK